MRVEYGHCVLYSRNGNPFGSFSELATRIGNALMPRSVVVLDGEIVSLDETGRAQFSDLLFRRSYPYFVAFDLLSVGNKDLRREQLIDRKQELQRILGQGIAPLIYADHIDGAGVKLFEKACELDLEGIVAKHRYSPYDPAAEPTWFKIRNQAYSQWAGRGELFERERRDEPVAGWHACTRAAAAGNGTSSI